VKRIHIIGRKNHGKTTLVVELVRELSARGFRVGTIKHTHHEHELDLPGKDSYRHREAGAAVAGIVSRSMNAVFWPSQPLDSATSDSRYKVFEPIFADCHVVLVEGDSGTHAIKIEVWRESLGTPPLAQTDPSVFAVISHDMLPSPAVTRAWPRGDIGYVASQVVALVL
jgi:molybdopterin-guanine dinucleotide biosynthesis protein B